MKSKKITLKHLLKDWEDYDIAEYYLSCSLGLMEYDEEYKNYGKAKSVFMTNNKIGNMLYELLEEMIKGGIIEKNEDDLLRWKKSFKGFWEN